VRLQTCVSIVSWYKVISDPEAGERCFQSRQFPGWNNLTLHITATTAMPDADRIGFAISFGKIYFFLG
jgi:hypothetical protein